MTKVVFHDWQPGFRKVAFNKLIRARCGLSLSEAIDAVGTVLDRRPLELSIDDPSAAADLVRDGMQLGAIGQVTESQSKSKPTIARMTRKPSLPKPADRKYRKAE